MHGKTTGVLLGSGGLRAACLASWYSEVAADALEIFQSGQVKLSAIERGRLLQAATLIADHAGQETGATTYQNPFDELSVEAIQFRLKFSKISVQFTGGLWSVFGNLPPEIRAKQRMAEQMYALLRDKSSPERRTQLPEEYVDEYERTYRSMLSNLKGVIAEYGEFSMEERP